MLWIPRELQNTLHREFTSLEDLHLKDKLPINLPNPTYLKVLNKDATELQNYSNILNYNINFKDY